MAILKDLIVHGSSRFLNKIYASEIQTPLIEAEAGIIKKLKADDVTVVGLLDVQGQMHTNSWTNSNIATIDGSFYITPTIECASGTLSSLTASTGTPPKHSFVLTAASGSSFAVVNSLYYYDTSAHTVTWAKYSKVLITGEILVGGEWIPLGTILGQLNADGASGSISIFNGQNNKHGTSTVLAELTSTNITSAEFRNLKISLYQRSGSTTTNTDAYKYPLGIYLTALGQNGKTFLDIYGGVNELTTSYGGYANPNVRIGNLSGLPAITTAAGNFTPVGWGIYTTNGYFSGTIVSNTGVIGGWKLGASSLYNGTTGLNNTTVGIYLGTDGIRNYQDTDTYVNITEGVIEAKGVNLTGTINATAGDIGGAKIEGGVLTVPAANISGELTAATINGSKITANSITAGQIAASAITTDELAANAVTSTKIKAGEVKADNIAANAVTAGKISVDNLSAITANLGTITTGVIKHDTVGGTNGIWFSADTDTSSNVTIGNSTARKDWRLLVNNKFGVTKEGNLYASSVDLTGKITATSGSIGGIDIINGDLDVSSINIGNLSGEIGGRNLIINTLNPDATAANRPKFLEQTVDTTGRGTASVAEHGIRFTTTSASYCYIYMGFTATSSGTGATLQGLTAGKTYTFSCDFTCKLLSADTSTTIRSLRFSLYDDTSGSFALDKQQHMIDLDASKKGTEQSGYFYYTFTLPANITKFGFMIRTNVTTNTLFLTGDFIELRNIKLEEGNKATKWSPAQKDVIKEGGKTATSYITQIDNTGIKITPYDQSGNDYLQLNSDAINMYRNNIETLRIEDSAIRIGKIGEGQKNVYIDNDSIDIRDNENILASFTGEDIKFYDGQIGGLEVASFGGANGVRIGNEEETHFVINNSAIKALNNNGATIFSIETTDTLIGNTIKIASNGTVPNAGGSITLETSSLLSGDEFYIEQILLKLRITAPVFDENGIICQNFQVNQTNQEITLLNHTAKGNPIIGFSTISNFVSYLFIGSNTFKYGTASSSVYNLSGTFSHYNGQTSYSGQITIVYDGNNTLTFNSLINSSSFGNSSFTLESDNSWYSYSDIMVRNKYSKAPALTFGTRLGDIGSLSTVIGEGLYAPGEKQMTIGKFNEGIDTQTSSYAFVVGNGQDDIDRSNAFTVDWNGNVGIQGKIHNIIISNGVETKLPLFHFESKTWTISSISGNGGSWYGTNVDRTIDVAGYTPVAIAGYSVWGGTNAGYCVVPRVYIDRETDDGYGNQTPASLQMYVWNRGTQTATNINFSVEILYIADNFID